MATLMTDLGEYLREQRQSARLSLRQLAEAAGVSNPYLSQVERGLRRPSAEVLQQIAKGLRISAEALYVRAGLLEERGDLVEVEAAILADPHLSERQRRVLLDIYETFRTENARSARPAMSDDEIDSVLAEVSPAPGRPATGRTATRKSSARSTSAEAGAKKTGAKSTGAKKTGTKRAATKRAATKTSTKTATKRTAPAKAAAGGTSNGTASA